MTEADDARIDQKMKDAAERNFRAISDSTVFCVLWNEKMVDEVIPLLQMGLAVYLDKPMYFLVPRGQQVPMNVRRLAIGFEEFEYGNEASLGEAMRKLLRHV